MAGKAIVAENLTYLYDELVAVDHINFSIDEGEILGFLGPNGAGKTTTVKMLTGQLKPKDGTVTLLGKDVAKHVEEIQGDIGVCFEITNLYEKMSAIENLNLFAKLFGVSDFDVEESLERVSLTGRGKDKVETYSKGMKQRLMVARSMINKPRVLFLDEPTAGLSPEETTIFAEFVKEISKELTVIMIEHDMDVVMNISDRIIVMHQGTKLMEGTPEQVKENEEVNQIYFVE